LNAALLETDGKRGDHRGRRIWLSAPHGSRICPHNRRFANRVPITLQDEWRPSMPLFNVGFVIFPDLTQLDFTGPQQVLARLPGSAMHIVAKSMAPVPSESGLGLVPTHTFENCPRLDLICPAAMPVSSKP
jgi:hypothetical protein